MRTVQLGDRNSAVGLHQSADDLLLVEPSLQHPPSPGNGYALNRCATQSRGKVAMYFHFAKPKADV